MSSIFSSQKKVFMDRSLFQKVKTKSGQLHRYTNGILSIHAEWNTIFVPFMLAILPIVDFTL